MRVATALFIAGSLFALPVHARSNDLLPIAHGTYVRDGVDASDPPLAALFEYDGSTISGPHSSACKSTLLAHAHDSYRLSTTCAALGDGTPAVPFTEVERIRVQSSTRVEFAHGHDVATYRLVKAS